MILIFDTSGSMESKELMGGGDPMMKRARRAVLNIVKEVVKPGDRVIFQTFGAGTEIRFNDIYKSEDRQKLIDAVPSKPGAGEGTNIRRPHHDALKLADAYKEGKTFIVLLTDSFNDQPKESTPEWQEYKNYYVPGQLSKYPNTPENGDYNRLLSAYPGISYGIGIDIDPVTGRPKERDPKQKIIADAMPEPIEAATPCPSKSPGELSVLALSTRDITLVDWRRSSVFVV